jgi:hypothetical protein
VVVLLQQGEAEAVSVQQRRSSQHVSFWPASSMGIEVLMGRTEVVG